MAVFFIFNQAYTKGLVCLTYRNEIKFLLTIK